MASRPQPTGRRPAQTRLSGFARARALAVALPGAEEGTSWGSPSLKVRGRMFACIPTHSSAEQDSLVVCLDYAQREEMIAAEPEIYYIKEHYRNYPSMLVRLPRIHDDALRDLLRMAWEFVGRRRKAGSERRRVQGRTRPRRKPA